MLPCICDTLTPPAPTKYIVFISVDQSKGGQARAGAAQDARQHFANAVQLGLGARARRSAGSFGRENRSAGLERVQVRAEQQKSEKRHVLEEN